VQRANHLPVCPGDPPTPASASFPRRVLLVAGVTATVVTAAYSGALTSAFAVQTAELPYDTIEEYVADPAFELAMSPNSYWVYLEVSLGAMIVIK
jgi:hypothetical protein